MSFFCPKIEDYEKLPKEKKFLLGIFYKRPPSYLMGEDFDSYFEKNFPIQYKIRNFFQNIKYFFKISYRDTRIKIKDFFSPCHPILRKSIPNHWVDLCDLIVDVNFAFILQFKEEMDTNPGVHDLEFSKWLELSVQYIKVEREDINKEIDKTLEQLDIKNFNNNNNKIISEKVRNLEDKIREKDKEIIKKMIDYKDHFWT